MKMNLKKKTRRNIRYKLVEGFVPEVTWGLNLMLGDAPAKGSVCLIKHIYPTPLFFLFKL